MTVSDERDTRDEPICPGCRAGDHHKCDEGAWDEWTDLPTYCRCWARNHKERL